MPALRKSARERDFRSQHHRSSTTPYASPTGTASEPPNEKKQRSITEWTEPPPQQLAPSFEEHGFARHGVVENMAPLGVPPKAKDKQRARALGEPALRNVLLGKGSAAFGDEVGSTPEVTPAPELEPDDSERHEEDEMRANYAVLEEEEDDDYHPAKAKKKVKISKTPIRGKTPVQSKTPVHGKTPVKNGHSKPASVSASPAVQPILMLEPVDEAQQQRMQIAVNEAISRAIKDDRRCVGLALKEIFEESTTDPAVAAVLESILQQTATDEQWESFRLRVKTIRKRIKMESKQQRSPQASSEVAPDDSASAVHDREDQRLSVSLKLKSKSMASATKDTHRALQSAIEEASVAASPHPFSTAPALPAADTSAESTPRMASKSPRKRATANGHPVSDVDMVTNGGASTTAPTPTGKTPDTSASESELSEVNEDIVQKGPPEPLQVNGKNSTPVPVAGPKKGKGPAVARAAKAKGNTGKLFGKHAQKAMAAERKAEADRLWEIRKTLLDQQPIRQLERLPVPVSDVRFDDEILETESLTESQIAVGPPVDTDQPRRAGRIPNHGTKRLREDVSRFSSPQLDSAAATRPSTPAVGPAPKRIKLTNGQAARTKRSPVKNRNGGPIAGLGYNGGGGSRQLGPDDYDPNSPQSESDDFCSACRGPGEFVCCESCPRVFHLLCCDPPRTEVPDGAFYCYECNAKLASDEPTASSYSSLGPLFKALERTNPRAFALPKDVQNNFEGVSARGDGSYFEEVKKFAIPKTSGYGPVKPDYTRLVDSNQKPILCAQCSTSSGLTRPLLKCDFCPEYWHLDCVTPPLANPPYIGAEATQRDAWRCPRHIEHDLRSGLLFQNDLNQPSYDAEVEMVDAAPAVRVARKIRKPKEPEVIEPTFSRGIRNNGLIEIINDPDYDTDGEGNYVFGPDDSKDLHSKIFRVPEKGVILDFLSKVKSGRIAKQKAGKSADAAAQRKANMQKFLARSIEQQQAALNLARLAKKNPETNLGEGKVSALILTLTAEAPPNVISAIDNAALPPVTENERAQLLRLQELIQHRLKA